MKLSTLPDLIGQKLEEFFIWIGSPVERDQFSGHRQIFFGIFVIILRIFMILSVASIIWSIAYPSKVSHASVLLLTGTTVAGCAFLIKAGWFLEEKGTKGLSLLWTFCWVLTFSIQVSKFLNLH